MSETINIKPTEELLVNAIIAGSVDSGNKRPCFIKVNGKLIQNTSKKFNWTTYGGAKNAIHAMIFKGWDLYVSNNILPNMEGVEKSKFYNDRFINKDGEYIFISTPQAKKYNELLDTLIKKGIVEITQDV